MEKNSGCFPQLFFPVPGDTRIGKKKFHLPQPGKNTLTNRYMPDSLQAGGSYKGIKAPPRRYNKDVQKISCYTVQPAIGFSTQTCMNPDLNCAAFLPDLFCISETGPFSGSAGFSVLPHDILHNPIFLNPASSPLFPPYCIIPHPSGS